MGYFEERQRRNLGEEVKKPTKQDLAKFYGEQDKLHNGRCENCGKSLAGTINFHPRAHVCHIIEKGVNGCPSVGTNENNVWFGCLSCHTIFDNSINNGNYARVQQMKIFPLLKERVKLFYDLIPANELRRVPEILKP